MSESARQSKVLRWLEKITTVVCKTVVLNKAGWPDIICCIDGIFVGIEMKDEGKKPTALQVHKLKCIEEAGGVGIWADSLEMVKCKLRHHPKLARVEAIQD